MLDLLKAIGIEIDGDFITFGGMDSLLLFKKEFFFEGETRMDVVFTYGESDAMWVQFVATDDPVNGWMLLDQILDVQFVRSEIVNTLIGLLENCVWESNVNSKNFGYGLEVHHWCDTQRRHGVLQRQVKFDEEWSDFYNKVWTAAKKFF